MKNNFPKDIVRTMKAFTLVEVLISLLLILIGILGIFKLQGHFFQGTTYSQQMVDAMNIGQDSIDRLMEIQLAHPIPTALTIGAHNNGDSAAGINHENVKNNVTYNVTWICSQAEDEYSTSIVLTVEWIDKGTKTITFQTVR
jgi:Tfp pilus assembly protein PilV